VVRLAAVLVALATVQMLLPSLRGGLPWIAALHVVNAAALATVTVNIARATGRPAAASRSREPLPVTAETS
jgi:hypothetical protein